MKYCKHGHAKTPENTYKHGACKVCARERSKQWYRDNPDIVKSRAKQWRKDHPEEVRSKYLKWKEDNPGKEQEKNRKWRLNNKQHEKEIKRVYYLNNKDKLLRINCLYRNNNPDKYKEYRLRWRKNNSDKVVSLTRKRQLAKIQRIPKWMTKDQLDAMDLMYLFARSMTKETGIKHEVDHIIPLRAINVSGLHVPWNLQVITKVENCRKSNTFISC